MTRIRLTLGLLAALLVVSAAPTQANGLLGAVGAQGAVNGQYDVFHGHSLPNAITGNPGNPGYPGFGYSTFPGGTYSGGYGTDASGYGAYVDPDDDSSRRRPRRNRRRADANVVGVDAYGNPIIVRRRR